MITKVCYVGEGFTRKPPKFERFIRPMVMCLNVPWQVILGVYVVCVGTKVQ